MRWRRRRTIERPQRLSSPRRRGTQYAAASRFSTDVSGILDHPPSRMTTVCVTMVVEPNRSIILQQPLDVIELDLRAGRIGQAAAQFFEDAAHPLHVDLAGDLHRVIV